MDGVEQISVELHVDDRGTLTAVDLASLPFAVKRMFTVTGVPAGTRRGGHSHRRGTQALFCLGGSIEVELRRDGATEQVELRPDGSGLIIRAGVWAEQHYVLDGSELLVLASEAFDPGTYERRRHGR